MSIEQHQSEIEVITEKFLFEFEQLDDYQLNWKPHSKSWSIAQNIHHLITINESYYPIIKSARTKTYRLPFIAKYGFIVCWMGKLILKSVNPSRKRKIKTFSVWKPSNSNFDKNILSDFVMSQQHLKQVVGECKDLLLADTIISSPANKYIVYKLEIAFEIIITHQKRHLDQAIEILKLIN